MADRVVNALVILVLAALTIVSLPILILYSPVYLVRWLRRRKGEDEDADIFRPTQMPMPAPLARASAWFKTEDAKGLLTLGGLAVILTGSLVAVFGMGINPIGVLIVAGLMTLGVLGIIGGGGGGPGDGGGGG